MEKITPGDNIKMKIFLMKRKIAVAEPVEIFYFYLLSQFLRKESSRSCFPSVSVSIFINDRA